MRRMAAPLLMAAAASLSAATLPEDRAEAMYHSYNGGGVEVDGPALEARQKIGSQVSASANYYVDSISAASIDVVTSASPYTEQRTEYGMGFDWLYGNALMNVGYSNSDESDYTSDTYTLGLSQTVFAGMTTLSMGYSHGDDVVERVDTDFEDSVDRDQFRLGMSQVVTPTIIASVDYEAITENGFLNNPYRSARILGAQVPEQYPRTRTSQAVSVGAMKSLGDRKSAVSASYRFFDDTWDITAHTLEAGYSRYVGSRWIVDLKYRYYTQNAASFYSDNFDRAYRYMARDKELSTFDSHAATARLTWNVFDGRNSGITKGNVGLSWEYLYFTYDDFTDIRSGDLYDFDSQVLQLYFSAWY
jgi:hypothetical protein